MYSTVPLFNELITKMRLDMLRHLNSGDSGEMPALLALFDLNEDMTAPLGATAHDVSTFPPGVAEGIMDDAFTDPDSPVNGVLYAREGYMILRGKGQPDEHPEDAADRQDALIVIARTKLTTETVIFAIDRATKTLTLIDNAMPRRQFSAPEQAAPEGMLH